MDRKRQGFAPSELPAAAAGGPVDKFRVTLAIYGADLDPDAVSAQLGLHPTRSHKCGDRKTPRTGPLPSGGWFLTREAVALASPNEAVVGLLRSIPGGAGQLELLSEEYEVQLRIAIHTDGWNRGFSLSSDAASLIASTKARLEFDLYFYGDASEV